MAAGDPDGIRHGRDRDAAPERASGGPPADRTRARDLARSALVNDDDPRFPWWLPLPGAALALCWGAWQAVSSDGGAGAAFVGAILWPGPAIVVLATLATFLGWQLEID